MGNEEISQNPSPEETARRYVGESGIAGDASNAYFHVAAGLGDPNLKPANTYESYIRKIKFVKRPDLADLVMRLSDPAKVKEFDSCIDKINESLKTLPPEEVAAAIRPQLDELEVITG